MVTIRELAKASGFSPTTISLVMNNSPSGRHIPESTREHIKKIANQLGYHPNQFARSLRSNRSQAVGIIVPDISDPYCAQILLGIDNSLYSSSYLPVLIDIQNSRARFRRYVSLIFERRIEGVIAVANSLQLQTEMLDIFETSGIPVIVIGRERTQEWMSSVSVANQTGARSAVEHLYTRGHRQIAFIKGPKRVVDTDRRWQGICNFAQEVSLRMNSKLIVQQEGTASSAESGLQAMHLLLKRRVKFTAVVAFDDIAAFGAIRALSQVGRKVPEDCSIVGFDDVPAAAYYTPPLTTVSQSMEDLGRTGARIFLDAVKEAVGNRKPFQPIHVELNPTLVIRDSTSAIQDPLDHG